MGVAVGAARPALGLGDRLSAAQVVESLAIAILLHHPLAACVVGIGGRRVAAGAGSELPG